MKAFIFNSGTGSRLGNLTTNIPKALVTLENGESILARQLRLLEKIGIRDIVISTGLYFEQIEQMCVEEFPTLNFKFVYSDKYNSTNNIYSLYLSTPFLDDDFIVLHGDLVFNYDLLKIVVDNEEKNIALINTSLEKPTKDFKGRVINGKLRKIDVNIFDSNDYVLQPLYKISRKILSLWLEEVEKFVNVGNVKVYAEDAFNNILKERDVCVIDYKGHYIDEIDTIEDYLRVSKEIRYFDYKTQRIVETKNYKEEIKDYLKRHNLYRPLLINSRYLLKKPEFQDFINEINATLFSDYSSNPKYEEVIKGLQVFKKNKCDAIIAVGGGSCIDVAKAIKLFSSLNPKELYLTQPYKFVRIPLIVAPTTAGTGSESTRYSAIYYKDEKQSITHDCLLPDLAILNSDFLLELPDYHKKSSLLDAFSQAVESYWAVNANKTSRAYAQQAIELFLENYKQYLDGDDSVNKSIMFLSNLAGRAINISATTAAHAMSYKLSSLSDIAHGHAVSLTLPYVYECIDIATHDINVSAMLNKLTELFSSNRICFKSKLLEIINSFHLSKPKIKSEFIKLLITSVNLERLSNTPGNLTEANVLSIYEKALELKNKEKPRKTIL